MTTSASLLPEYGICTTTEGTDTANDLYPLTATSPVSRFVLTAQRPHLVSWHLSLGRLPHGTVARETLVSYGLNPDDDNSFPIIAGLLHDAYKHDLAYLEVGNEPDEGGWLLSPQRFSRLLQAFCTRWHQPDHSNPESKTVLISGGLQTWQPAYAAAVQFPSCFVFGLHAYNKTVGGFGPPGGSYGPIEGWTVYLPYIYAMRGIAFTEWGMTDDREPFASEYLKRMTRYFADDASFQSVNATNGVGTPYPVVTASYFSLYDRQHAGAPHGLIRSTGQPKKAYYTYPEVIQMATTDELAARIDALQSRVETLERQQGYQTGALKAVGQLHWKPGAESLEGQLIALTGDSSLTVKDFPPKA